ncbi:MAG: hypothetical protein DMG39_25805 [Acidobacteria bacterium]|nr:MAG: hypothetical protein DMG39_25805 [Acidobacteriota bacterium]
MLSMEVGGAGRNRTADKGSAHLTLQRCRRPVLNGARFMLSAAGWRPSLRDEDVLHESGVASCEPTQQPAPNQTRGAFQDCIRESEMNSPF